MALEPSQVLSYGDITDFSSFIKFDCFLPAVVCVLRGSPWTATTFGQRQASVSLWYFSKRLFESYRNCATAGDCSTFRFEPPPATTLPSVRYPRLTYASQAWCNCLPQYCFWFAFARSDVMPFLASIRIPLGHRHRGVGSSVTQMRLTCSSCLSSVKLSSLLLPASSISRSIRFSCRWSSLPFNTFGFLWLCHL